MTILYLLDPLVNSCYIIPQSKIHPALPSTTLTFLLFNKVHSHWNIYGFRSHTNDLHYEPRVICLQETFSVQPPTPIPNSHFIHSPHSIAAASILIHHNTPYTYLNIDTTIPCIVMNLPSTLGYHCL